MASPSGPFRASSCGESGSEWHSRFPIRFWQLAMPPSRAPTPTPTRAGPVPLEPWLEHLEKHLVPARRGEVPEAVHQIRAAAARLEVWLRLAGWRILRDDLRWLRRSAAAVRDIDVLLAYRVSGEVRAALSKQREAAQRLLASALGRVRTQALLRALHLLPPLEAERAHRALERWSAKVLKEGDLADFDSDSPARLHRLRRRARRLRFAREWLDIESEALHELQKELGDLHDLAVLQSWIATADDASEDLPSRMRKARERAKKAWSEVREEILES